MEMMIKFIAIRLKMMARSTADEERSLEHFGITDDIFKSESISNRFNRLRVINFYNINCNAGLTKRSCQLVKFK